MTDDYFFKIEIDDSGFNKEIDNYMDTLIEIVLLQVAERLLALIVEQIEERLFDTIYGNMVHGIVDFGQYKDSWEMEPVDDRNIRVQNFDEKARGIEWGTAPEDNFDLKWKDILAWSKRKNVPESLARDIYQVIKYERGTVPKPAVRRSLDSIIRQPDLIEKAVSDKMMA